MRAAIVIPAFNRIDLLRVTLHNACLQTERDIEIFVVNDNSKEDVRGAVEAQNDSRVRYLDSPGKGASAARNFGIEQATADYVVLLDSDDLLHPTMIERLALILDGDASVQLAVGQMAHFSESPMSADLLWNTFDPTPFPGKQRTPCDRFLAHEPVWGIHGPLWRRSALVELGGLDTSLPLAQDYELHTRALASGMECRLVPTILSYCRTHQSISIGSDKTYSRQRVLLEVFERLASLPPLVGEVGEALAEPGGVRGSPASAEPPHPSPVPSGHRPSPTRGGRDFILQGDYLWIAAFAADGGIPDLAFKALLLAHPTGFAGLMFRLSLRARLMTGRHVFHTKMHHFAREMGHDLDARVDWLRRHQIADEPNLEWPAMPTEAWQVS